MATIIESTPATSVLSGGPVPGVSLYFSPCAVVIGKKTYLFHNSANNDGQLYLSTKEESGSWSSDHPVKNVLMNQSPSAVYWNSVIYIFYQGTANTNSEGQLWYSIMTPNGDLVPGRRIQGISMTDSPNAVIVGDRIRVFYQSTDNNKMYYIDVN